MGYQDKVLPRDVFSFGPYDFLRISKKETAADVESAAVLILQIASADVYFMKKSVGPRKV